MSGKLNNKSTRLHVHFSGDSRKLLRIDALTLVVAALVISAAAAQEMEQNNGYVHLGGILPISTYHAITLGNTDLNSKCLSAKKDDLTKMAIHYSISVIHPNGLQFHAPRLSRHGIFNFPTNPKTKMI